MGGKNFGGNDGAALLLGGPRASFECKVVFYSYVFVGELPHLAYVFSLVYDDGVDGVCLMAVVCYKPDYTRPLRGSYF